MEMNIGIDIDDTIADTTAQMLHYIKQEQVLQKAYHQGDIMQKGKELLRGVALSEESKQFYKKYAKDVVLNVKPKQSVKQKIQELKDRGHQIYIITTRGENHFKGAYEATYDWLMENNITFDELICDANEKVEACKEKNIDVMIDDSIETCERLQENGIDCLVMNSYFNEQDATKLPRVNTWEEVANYIKEKE